MTPRPSRPRRGRGGGAPSTPASSPGVGGHRDPRLRGVVHVTFIPTHHDSNNGQHQTVLEVEAWFRPRADIEDRIREAKLGAGMRHLPSGQQSVNRVWMWAALLAGNLSALLQALTRIDEHGRAHAVRLRHGLLCVPARLVRRARRLTFRLPPGDQLLPTVLSRIGELDTAA